MNRYMTMLVAGALLTADTQASSLPETPSEMDQRKRREAMTRARLDIREVRKGPAREMAIDLNMVCSPQNEATTEQKLEEVGKVAAKYEKYGKARDLVATEAYHIMDIFKLYMLDQLIRLSKPNPLPRPYYVVLTMGELTLEHIAPIISDLVGLSYINGDQISDIRESMNHRDARIAQLEATVAQQADRIAQLEDTVIQQRDAIIGILARLEAAEQSLQPAPTTQ